MRERILPSVGLTAHIPNVCRMEPVKWRPRDITDEIMGRILPPLPEHMIELIHVCVVGAPGSGKTEMVRYLARSACDKYGRENVNMVVTDDLKIAIDMIDGRPVQFLFVDDAAKYNNSKQAAKKENVEKAGDFQLLRHIQRKASGRRNGLVICIFGWQRYMDLIPALRGSYITLFKSGQAEEYDHEMVEKKIGPYASVLSNIWDRAKRGDLDAKNLSVAYIATLRGTGREAGIFRSAMVDFPEFPEMISRADYVDDEPEEEVEIELDPAISAQLEQLRDTLGDHVVRCYEAVESGLSMRQAAERLDIPYTTLRRYVISVREALEGAADHTGCKMEVSGLGGPVDRPAQNNRARA